MRTGDGLRLPINGAVRDVKVGIGLPEVKCAARDGRQVHSLLVLTVQEIGRIDLTCIHQMVLGKQVLFC